MERINIDLRSLSHEDIDSIIGPMINDAKTLRNEATNLVDIFRNKKSALKDTKSDLNNDKYYDFHITNVSRHINLLNDSIDKLFTVQDDADARLTNLIYLQTWMILANIDILGRSSS